MPFLERLLKTPISAVVERAVHSVPAREGQSRFLNYDLTTLHDWYRGETRLWNVLPYAELAEIHWPAAEAFQVRREEEWFRLRSPAGTRLERLRAGALEAFRAEKRFDRESTVIRLEEFRKDTGLLRVRPGWYTDGLRSNYAMDWSMDDEDRDGTALTLRSYLAERFGERLPPLGESLLSDAVGLAVVVWYRGQGDILPYLPRRAGGRSGQAKAANDGDRVRTAVFDGGYHCTASGESEWTDGAHSFDEMFVAEICRELEEEVGIQREDLEWIVPAGLCREFLRGGKPQLFFAALTNLDGTELAIRRKAAIASQIARGRQEVVDDCLIAEDPEQVYRDLARHGTIEAVANLSYAHRCLVSAVFGGAVRT